MPGQKILAYIRNNWRLSDSPSNAKLIVKTTDVVWLQQKPKVFAEIARLLNVPSATEDTAGWFPKRMVAIGNVIADMTAEERSVLDSEVDRITAAGFPEEERMRCGHYLTCASETTYMFIFCRRAAKHSGRRLDAAAKAQFLEMGLLSVTFFTREEFTGGVPRLAVEV